MAHAVMTSQGFSLGGILHDFNTGSLALVASMTFTIAVISNGVSTAIRGRAINSLLRDFFHKRQFFAKLRFNSESSINLEDFSHPKIKHGAKKSRKKSEN